jgi:hypothetical protein
MLPIGSDGFEIRLPFEVAPQITQQLDGPRSLRRSLR